MDVCGYKRVTIAKYSGNLRRYRRERRLGPIFLNQMSITARQSRRTFTGIYEIANIHVNVRERALYSDRNPEGKLSRLIDRPTCSDPFLTLTGPII